MICPRCDSVHIVKNGVRKNRKQNNICLLCDCQFVGNPSCHYCIIGTELKSSSRSGLPKSRCSPANILIMKKIDKSRGLSGAIKSNRGRTPLNYFFPDSGGFTPL